MTSSSFSTTIRVTIGYRILTSLCGFVCDIIGSVPSRAQTREGYLPSTPSPRLLLDVTPHDVITAAFFLTSLMGMWHLCSTVMPALTSLLATQVIPTDVITPGYYGVITVTLHPCSHCDVTHVSDDVSVGRNTGMSNKTLLMTSSLLPLMTSLSSPLMIYNHYSLRHHHYTFFFWPYFW